MYNYEVYNGKLDMDPFAPLEEVTQGMLKSLHKPATNAFTHTTSNASKPGRVSMMRNCVIQGEACNKRYVGNLYKQTSKSNIPTPHKEEE